MPSESGDLKLLGNFSKLNAHGAGVFWHKAGATPHDADATAPEEAVIPPSACSEIKVSTICVRL